MIANLTKRTNVSYMFVMAIQVFIMTSLAESLREALKRRSKTWDWQVKNHLFTRACDVISL